MSRFKELKRIEIASKDRNQTELRWASTFCEMRIKIAQRKEHQKYWRGIEKKVRAALGGED